ncbi:phage tail protein [Gallibacterium genomosp. 3]|uniref:phage tail-collar fiber domain-containing protein n=1 Tax=Gallibacterium genomosp. 3 TaxID=505345 RepID=UPI0008025E70|nr:phage tail protein [Gallibacterium genomosp. 3]
MAKQYYSILTAQGELDVARAVADLDTVKIKKIALGDGNGAIVVPVRTQTTLIHEVYRNTVTAVYADRNNNQNVVVELNIPPEIGGFYIREIGVYNEQDQLIAVGNYPETFKPMLSSGSGQSLLIRIILRVQATDNIELTIDNSTIYSTRLELTPKTITGNTGNVIEGDGHTHEIDKASTTTYGITKLTNDVDNSSPELAASAIAVKTAYDKAIEVESQVTAAKTTANQAASQATAAQKTANQAVSQATAAQTTANQAALQATAAQTTANQAVSQATAAQTTANQAASKATAAGKKGLPVGAIVGFPKEITQSVGFLKCDGSTFNQATYPDLYRTLGNKNKLPDLRHNDIGQLAYFATDTIPEGWIAFDSIRTTVTQQHYPELYALLVAKYGAINNVPLVEDRFIRNAGNGLTVGQTQEDAFKKHKHRFPNGSRIGDDNFRFDFTYEGAMSSPDYRTDGRGPINVLRNYGSNEINNNFAYFYGEHTSEGGDETRPKSIVFKLCIKATGSSNTVNYWIKAYGEVINAGQLDAATLAQALHNKADFIHEHTAEQITDFEQRVLHYISQSFTQTFTESGWCKLPNGLIIQWGKFKAGWDYTTQRRVSFPITFPHSVFFIGLTEFTNVWSYASTVQSREKMDRSGFDVVSQRNDTMFFAVGY